MHFRLCSRSAFLQIDLLIKIDLELIAFFLAAVVYGCCTAALNTTLVNYQTYFGGTFLSNGAYVGGNKTATCGMAIAAPHISCRAFHALPRSPRAQIRPPSAASGFFLAGCQNGLSSGTCHPCDAGICAVGTYLTCAAPCTPLPRVSLASPFAQTLSPATIPPQSLQRMWRPSTRLLRPLHQ